LIAANQSLVREQQVSKGVRKEVWDAYQRVAKEDEAVLAALDDGDTYESAALKAAKRPKDWLVGKLVVDKDNVSKL
jgi:hypothetical protein